MGVIHNDTRLRSCVIMVGCGTSMNCSYRMHASRRQFVWVSIEAHSIYAWKVWSRARGNMHPSILSKLFRFDRTAEAAPFPEAPDFCVLACALLSFWVAAVMHTLASDRDLSVTSMHTHEAALVLKHSAPIMFIPHHANSSMDDNAAI